MYGTSTVNAHNVTATGTVVTGACHFNGFSIGSTAGAAVVIYDATSATGTVLASFTLLPAGFQNVDLPRAVKCLNGIHLTASAAIQGHVRVG